LQKTAKGKLCSFPAQAVDGKCSPFFPVMTYVPWTNIIMVQFPAGLWFATEHTRRGRTRICARAKRQGLPLPSLPSLLVHSFAATVTLSSALMIVV